LLDLWGMFSISCKTKT